MTRRHDGDETWRDGGSTEPYPPMWPRRMGDWPTITPHIRWTPTADKATVICYRDRAPCEMVDFDSTAAAIEALQELYSGPCGPGCIGDHALIAALPGRLIVSTRRGQMTPEQLRHLQDAAVESAAHRTSKPGGIAAAAAESHDQAVAHEAVAKSLTEAALAQGQ